MGGALDKRGQTPTDTINRIGSAGLTITRREWRGKKTERGKQEGAEGTELWGKQSRGYRGKAEGAASIVPHNGGFVQSEGGWDQGAVCVCGCRRGGLELQSSSLRNEASCWGREEDWWRAHPGPE